MNCPSVFGAKTVVRWSVKTVVASCVVATLCVFSVSPTTGQDRAPSQVIPLPGMQTNEEGVTTARTFEPLGPDGQQVLDLVLRQPIKKLESDNQAAIQAALKARLRMQANPNDEHAAANFELSVSLALKTWDTNLERVIQGEAEIKSLLVRQRDELKYFREQAQDSAKSAEQRFKDVKRSAGEIDAVLQALDKSLEMASKQDESVSSELWMETQQALQYLAALQAKQEIAARDEAVLAQTAASLEQVEKWLAGLEQRMGLFFAQRKLDREVLVSLAAHRLNQVQSQSLYRNSQRLIQQLDGIEENFDRLRQQTGEMMRLGNPELPLPSIPSDPRNETIESLRQQIANARMGHERAAPPQLPERQTVGK